MYLPELINQLKDKGMHLEVVDGKIYLGPKSAITSEIRTTIEPYKQQILVYLIHEQGGVESLYINPPICHNPFTPHSSHVLPWECDPNSCYCYQHFGYPRFCKGVPCRWIWPRYPVNQGGQQ